MPANLFQAYGPFFVHLGGQARVLPGHPEQQINAGGGQQGAVPQLFKGEAFF